MNQNLPLAASALPERLPIFPLPNAVVMPGCHLPLSIFEPRYIDMVTDALGSSRLIGMVQPETGEEGPVSLYRTGTAGRIVSFNELPDGRQLIVLRGVSRFDIVEELAVPTRYRQVRADWGRFAADQGPAHDDGVLDRERLMNLLRHYFERKGYEADWPTFDAVPAKLLVNMLVGHLPLGLLEKQALIEAVTPSELVNRFMHLLEFDVASTAQPVMRLQ